MTEPTSANAAPRIEAVRFLAGEQLQRGLVEDIVERTSRRLAVPVRLQFSAWDRDARRLDGRDQFDADALLASLEATATPGTVRIGLSAHDFGLALFTFIFGRARRNGHTAVVSLARLGPERYGLPPDPELEANRAVAEVMHELGHVAGLVHCRDLRCIMYFATNVEMIDLRGASFCSDCGAALPSHLVARGVQMG